MATLIIDGIDGDASSVTSAASPSLQKVVVLTVGAGLHVVQSIDSIRSNLADAFAGLQGPADAESVSPRASATAAATSPALRSKAGAQTAPDVSVYPPRGLAASVSGFSHLRLSADDMHMSLTASSSSSSGTWESVAAQRACATERSSQMSRPVEHSSTSGTTPTAQDSPLLLQWLAGLPSVFLSAAACELGRHSQQPRMSVTPFEHRSPPSQYETSAASASKAQLTGQHEAKRHRSHNKKQAQAQAQLQASVAAAAASVTTSAAPAAAAVAPAWLQAATVAAGAASRTLAQVAIHPLDTLKTRMQVSVPAPQLQVWRAVMSSAASCAATRRAALLAWAGPAGARDLFLGLSGAVGGTLPSAALFFATEAAARPALAGLMGCEADAAPARLLASASAAAASALIRVPADVLKHRVQAYVYPSVAAAARDIVSRRGLAGLYAGFGATLLRDAPELVIQFTAYTHIKALLNQHRHQHSHGADSRSSTASKDGKETDQQHGKQRATGGGVASGPAAAMAEHLAVGGAAGAAAALATTPLDVIKTQLQCGGASSVGGAVAQALRAGGGSPAALFAGLGPRLLQTTLCSALFFTCYEASKARLGQVAAAQHAQQALKALREVEQADTVPAFAAPAAVAAAPQHGGGRFWRRRRGNGSSSGSGSSDLWEARAELEDA